MEAWQGEGREEQTCKPEGLGASARSDGRNGSALMSCFLRLMRPTVKSSCSPNAQLRDGKCSGAGFCLASARRQTMLSRMKKSPFCSERCLESLLPSAAAFAAGRTLAEHALPVHGHCQAHGAAGAGVGTRPSLAGTEWDQAAQGIIQGSWMNFWGGCRKPVGAAVPPRICDGKEHQVEKTR